MFSLDKLAGCYDWVRFKLDGALSRNPPIMEPNREQRGLLVMSLPEAEASQHRSAEPGASFDMFYASNWSPTVRLAFLLTSERSVAEDLAQDAFIRVRRHFDRADNPIALLHTVTVNVCRNWQRSRIRERERIVRVVSGTQTADAPIEGSILDLVAGLPFRQRAVVVLRYWSGLSETEIAERVGCRAGTVKSLSSRALSTLRKEIKGEF